MRKVVLTVIICALAAAIAGSAGYYTGVNSHKDISSAVPREEMTMTPVPPAETNADNQSESITYVTRSDVSAAADGVWTTVGTYEGDMTGDGQSDTLTIYTSAESIDGEILWDDGQSWIAEVTDAQGGYYALLSRYVSNGSVYAEVSESGGGEKTITLIVTSGGGLSVTRYSYSSSGFAENVVARGDGANVLYSSIPFYK